MNDTSHPRAVTISEAARYVGLKISGYRAAVQRGIFPGPVPGTQRYDLRAIDHCLDKLSGIACAAPVKELSPLEKWRAEQNGNRPQAYSHR